MFSLRVKCDCILTDLKSKRWITQLILTVTSLPAQLSLHKDNETSRNEALVLYELRALVDVARNRAHAHQEKKSSLPCSIMLSHVYYEYLTSALLWLGRWHQFFLYWYGAKCNLFISKINCLQRQTWWVFNFFPRHQLLSRHQLQLLSSYHNFF